MHLALKGKQNKTEVCSVLLSTKPIYAFL